MVDLFLLASLPFGARRAVMPFVITFLSMDVILARLACLLEFCRVIRLNLSGQRTCFAPNIAILN